MKHSSKGRKGKVFKQGNANISFTGKSVTANFGMALGSRAFETFHIPELLRAVTEDLDPGKRHSTRKPLQQLIALSKEKNRGADHIFDFFQVESMDYLQANSIF